MGQAPKQTVHVAGCSNHDSQEKSILPSRLIFSKEAFLVHRPGWNPQPQELYADIGRVRLMLI
jgi:hypothetical protein